MRLQRNGISSKAQDAESTGSPPTQERHESDIESSSSTDETDATSKNMEKGRTFAKDPFSWNQLVDIVVHKNDLHLLSRSGSQERVYLAHRDTVKQNWKSVYDFILHTKFQFDKRRLTEKKQVWEAYPPLSDISTVRKILVLNDFPYYVEKGIEHWCLWKLCEPVTDQDIAEAKDELQRMNNKVLDTIHWINPPHLKSLPDIDHAHILCLRETDDDNANITGETI